MSLADLLGDFGADLVDSNPVVAAGRAGSAFFKNLDRGSTVVDAMDAGFAEGTRDLPAGVDALGAAMGWASTNIPGFDTLMAVVDAPRRAIDTALITSQASNAAGARRGSREADLGEFLNASTWARAWDAASWDAPNRVTGGQILAGAAFGGDTFAYDPFDTVEAARLQDAALGSWYGRTMATVIDLGESLVSVPGAGVLARGRAAAGTTTIADAEAAALRFNEAGAVGRSTVQKVGDKTRQYMVPNGAQNVDALVERQVAGLRELDGVADEWQVFNKLKSRLPTAPDGDVANIANVLTEINKVPDAAVRDRLRTNFWLSALGSSTAKRAFIQDAPLLAKNFESLTSTPREAGALSEIYALRLDGDDLPINDVIERVWNTTSDKAELGALRKLVARRRTALTDHDRLVRELRDLEPAGGDPSRGDWRAMVDEAETLRAEAAAGLDEVAAEATLRKGALDAKRAEIAAVRPHLKRNNELINSILDVAGKDSALALAGDAAPTLLSRVKEHIRDRIGAEEYVIAGEGNTILRLRSLPSRSAKMALAPQARGQIALNEVGLGARQMADSMARSKVFSTEEIARWRNALIRVPAAERVGVVSRIQDLMVERMATRFFRERVPDLTPEEAAARAKEITGLTTKSWGKGNDWVAKAADEQVADDMIILRDIEGGATAYDAPMLRSQLADSAPVLDPWDFERLLKSHEKTFVGNVRAGLSAVANTHDFAIQVWKVGALLRPGLMVRSMLDTGPRALASMSAAESLAAAMNGAANLVHNKALSGLAKVRFGGLSVDEAAARARYLGLKPVRVGGKYEFQFASDTAELQTFLSATSKGQTVHGALFHEMAQKYDSLKLDRSSWKRNAPDSALWHVAYKEYADMLLASPSARRLADMLTRAGDDVAKAVDEIKASPEFTSEYRKYAQPMGRTRSEFLQQLVHEVDLMFASSPRAFTAARNGGLNKKLIDREFPREARFDIPAPEMSALQAADRFKVGKDLVDRAFRTLLDKPDMWLARNPVAVQVFNRRVKQEVRAFEARFGRDYEISAAELKAIENKARGAAIGYVRDTFFDTTRYTGLHRAMARFSPFIAAWEDAMISWGRLIYDDPRRLTRLMAAYKSPYTVSASNDWNLVVDENGQPVGRGDDPDAVFVAVPLGALGRKFGVDEYRIRVDAFNSIAQGETWWLPGVGPSVAVAATFALGSGRVVSREAALDIVENDNPLGRALLKSVFLGGEVPPSDAGSLAKSTLPGWVRTLTTETLTTGKIRTRQTNFNYRVAQALAEGRTLTPGDYTRMWDEADRSANAAAVTRLAMSAGFGFTGTAAVDGQFYADQLHIIYGMTPEQRGGATPEEFFAQKFPEAADLDWSITKNETGVVASVNAAKAESRLSGTLKANPADLGWMILGRDNMVEREFSRTAYSMQRSDGNRTYQDPRQAQMEAQAAVGYRLVNAYQQQVIDQLVAAGMPDEQVESSPQFRAARKVIADYVADNNPAYAQKRTEFRNRFDYYYGQAKRLAGSGPLRDRSDMAAFRDYDAARTEVMTYFGVASLDGTSEKYVAARAAMYQVGTYLAQRDLGFQQMWERFLEREVD